MKFSIYPLLAIMLLALSATSQTPDYSQWITTITIDGKDIHVLRADETKFPSTIFGHISGAQSMLNDLRYIYKNSMGDSYNSNYGIVHSCEEIEKADKSFPVHYYREELQAYQNAHDAIKKKAQDEINARIAREEAEKERLRIERLKTSYFWINRDSINVRSKPNTQSLIIGQIHRLSYVRAYDVENKPDWVEISFEYDGYTGYILAKYLADDWEELNPTAEDSVSLVGGPNCNFVANEANLAKVRQAQAAQEQRAASSSKSGSGRKYHLGPKGGCYFINSHGNKEYVDRSYCN